MDIPALLLLAGAAILVAQFVFLVCFRLYRRWQEVRVARVRGKMTGPLVALLTSDIDAPARDAFLEELPGDQRSRATASALMLETLPKLRGSARQGLAELFDETGFTGQYVNGLRSTTPWRRAASAYALGELQVGRAFTTPRRLLEDPAREVRLSVARALGKLGRPEAVESLVDAYDRGGIAAVPAAASILRIGPSSAEPLRDLLGHADAGVRAMAAQLLGQLNVFDAAPQLVALLGDSEARVRAAAARSLGRLSAEEAEMPLVVVLADGDADVRAAAATALGQIPSTGVIYALRVALADEADEVRRAAASALAALGAPGTAELVRVLKEGMQFQRIYAAEALERSGFADRMVDVWLMGHPGAPLDSADDALRALAATGATAPFEGTPIRIAADGTLTREKPAPVRNGNGRMRALTSDESATRPPWMSDAPRTAESRWE
jgi:HEAT repeat protein